MACAAIIQFLACTVMIYIAIEDMNSFTIKNKTVIVLLILLLIDTAINIPPWPTGSGILFGLASLAAIFVIYGSGAVGGGDAKLLWVSLLWVGSERTSLFLLILGLASAAYYLAHRLLGILPARPGPKGTTIIPYGPSIAIAWIGATILRLGA